MNHVDKIAYEYAKVHGDVGFDYGKVYDAVKYGYNRALEDAWKPSEEQMEHLKRCFSHGKPHLPIPNQHVLESLYKDLENYFGHEI